MDDDTLSRRGMLGAVAGFALVPLVGGCGDNTTTDPTIDGSGSAGCAKLPSETAGPFPGDGTNGANALTLPGINRSDIRTSIGTATGTADGVELKVTLTLISASTCEPLVGYAVYIWHCDRPAAYSMYAGTALNENYLRGVQVSDANGQLTFITIFPGCYPGRWPHMHFEVFASLDDAMNGGAKKLISQLALTKASCDEVYATAGYETSQSTASSLSIESDGVFSDDDGALQVATVTGGVGANLTATLTIAIAT
jgi:protocatechuate 3,4-dioxygenase beta subunit